LADAFEAIIGAVFIDRGFEIAKSFIMREMEEYINESVIGATLLDYKSLLQEEVQKTDSKLMYEIVEEKGPAHDKTFVSKVFISDVEHGFGEGKTKKESEQNAAKIAYENIIK
jgi:ribonuclease-3